MKGKMLVFHPGDPTPVVVEFERALVLEELQKVVDGYFEKVPHFDTFPVDGQRVRCVALCNEDGKLEAMRANLHATTLWRTAVRYRGLPEIHDQLHGPVAVCMGDEEWMGAL